MADPGKLHWAALKWMMRYIIGSLNLALSYGERGFKIIVTSYVDSDYAACLNSRRLTSGVWRSSELESLITKGGGSFHH